VQRRQDGRETGANRVKRDIGDEPHCEEQKDAPEIHRITQYRRIWQRLVVDANDGGALNGPQEDPTRGAPLHSLNHFGGRLQSAAGNQPARRFRQLEAQEHPDQRQQPSA